MIAEVGIEPLFQRPRSQTQGLPPDRHLQSLEIQIGDGLLA